MYSACLTIEEFQLIQASVVGCVRRIQIGAPEVEAIKFTTAAAELLTRLNEACIDQGDVEFINLCLQKTVDLLHKDPRAPQRSVVIMKCGQIQNKLGGKNVRPMLGVSSAVQ